MNKDSLFLIGIANTKFKLLEITSPKTINEVIEWYGKDSYFETAFEIASDFNIDNVLMMNIDSWDDLKQIDDILKQYEFTYLVPLGLKITDYFSDKFNNNNKIYYSQYLLWMTQKTDTTIIMTGDHASAYENLTSFLDDMNKDIKQIKYRFSNLPGSNFIYVANNSQRNHMADVTLSCVMLSTPIEEYPSSNKIGPVVFDIDKADIINEIVYFKENLLTGYTIENLLNFSTGKIMKLVPVARIIKFISKDLPKYEDYIGQKYSEYKTLKIRESLNNYLNDIVDKYIYKFEIISITPIKNRDNSVTIILKFVIWPKFTTEKYIMETKI